VDAFTRTLVLYVGATNTVAWLADADYVITGGAVSSGCLLTTDPTLLATDISNVDFADYREIILFGVSQVFVPLRVPLPAGTQLRVDNGSAVVVLIPAETVQQSFATW
jgi:hypothetical protein